MEKMDALTPRKRRGRPPITKTPIKGESTVLLNLNTTPTAHETSKRTLKQGFKSSSIIKLSKRSRSEEDEDEEENEEEEEEDEEQDFCLSSSPVYTMRGNYSSPIKTSPIQHINRFKREHQPQHYMMTVVDPSQLMSSPSQSQSHESIVDDETIFQYLNYSPMVSLPNTGKTQQDLEEVLGILKGKNSAGANGETLVKLMRPSRRRVRVLLNEFGKAYVSEEVVEMTDDYIDSNGARNAEAESYIHEAIRYKDPYMSSILTSSLIGSTPPSVMSSPLTKRWVPTGDSLDTGGGGVRSRLASRSSEVPNRAVRSSTSDTGEGFSKLQIESPLKALKRFIEGDL